MKRKRHTAEEVIRTLREAETLLISNEADAGGEGAKPETRSGAAKRLVAFYEEWEKTEPGNGYGDRAAE